MKLPIIAALAACLLAPVVAIAPSAALAQSANGAAVIQKPITATHCSTFASPNIVKDSGVICNNKAVTVTDPGVAGAAGITISPTYFGGPSPLIANNTTAHSLIFQRGVASTGADAGDFFFSRSANYTGGTSGFVNPVAKFVTTNSPGTTAYEWTGLFQMINNGVAADASQDVAAYFQTLKQSTGSSWAAVSEIKDSLANPTAPTVAHEFDMRVTGADSIGAGGRAIMDAFATSLDGNAATVRHGLRLNTDTHTTLTNGIELNGNFTQGINLTGGTYTGSNAFLLGDTNHLCVDTFCTAYLFHSGGVLYYSTPSGNIISFSDTGQITGVIVNSSGGDILFGGATSSYPMLRRNAAALDVKLANNGAYTNLTAANLVISATGGHLCLDGTACFNNFSASGTTISTASTLSTSAGISAASVAGGAISGSSLSVSGNVGAANVNASGNMVANGAILAGAGYLVGGGTSGVSCSGAPTGAFAVSGGIVTHC